MESVSEPKPPDEALRRALARRADWLEEQASSGTDCLRLLHGAVEGAPGLTVDRYGEVLLIQTGREPLASGLVDRLARVASDAVAAELVPVWNHRPAFREPGGFAGVFCCPDLRDARGHEEGSVFRVDPRGGGLDPLLFLDLRAGRRRVRELAEGARVLNLFAYTCGLGVAAAAGGAREVVNVDFSASALAIGAKNATLNGFGPPSMSFVQEDFFPVVRQLAGLPVKGRGARGRDYLRMAPRTFDLIALDPPRWAKTPFGAVDVARDYPSLLKPVLMALEPGGVVLATNHLPTVLLEDFLAVLHRTALKIGRRLEDVEVVTPDPDFPSPDGHPPLKMVVATVR